MLSSINALSAALVKIKYYIPRDIQLSLDIPTLPICDIPLNRQRLNLFRELFLIGLFHPKLAGARGLDLRLISALQEVVSLAMQHILIRNLSTILMDKSKAIGRMRRKKCCPLDSPEGLFDIQTMADIGSCDEYSR